MRRSFRKSILFLLQGSILYLLGSCLTPVDVPVDLTPGTIVISGQVSPVLHRSFVTVGLAQGSGARPIPVTFANVRIEDDIANSWQMSEGPEGYYANPSLVGQPGRTYKVIVETQEGKVYESKAEKMPEVLGTDEVSREFETRQVVDKDGTPLNRLYINLKTRFRLPSQSQAYYLRWSVEEIWVLVPTDFPDPFGNIPPNCYITQAVDAQRITLLQGQKAGKNIDTEFLVATRLADQASFHTRHSFYIYQSSITAEAHEYWRKVDLLVNQVGTIFDTPPAEVQGNVRNVKNAGEKVFGYFQVCNEKFRKMTLYRYDMPFEILPYCEYDSFKPPLLYPTECLDCITSPNSSYIEPELFTISDQ